MSEEGGGAVGPLTAIAVLATVAIVIVLANTALSAFAGAFKNAVGADVFMQPEYTAIWSKVSQFAWAIVAVTFAAAAFTVWKVIRER
jgi:riboflavin transporter FmnP